MYILLFVSAIRSLELFPIAVNVKFHYFKAGVFNESSKKSGSYISFPVVVRKIYMAPIINIKFPNFNNYMFIFKKFLTSLFIEKQRTRERLE